MRFTSETTVGGVTERVFVLGDIPGALWTPPGGAATRPLILLGHGGGAHKLAPGILARARRYVVDCGFAAAAIDAPGHGDRPKSEQAEQRMADIRRRREAGEPVAADLARHHDELAGRAVPEWRSTLDALRELGHDGPVGYWGVSLGSAIGIPLVAAEPRISAAVLGLIGHETLAEPASRITVPVEFLVQWDDELVSRDFCLSLFGAFGSVEKTLHANVGGHMAVPVFELDSAERFFCRHLGG